MKKPEKVIVGISGGVDSAVAAVMLKKQGYEVEGVFLRLWRNDNVEKFGIKRNDTEAENDAKKICGKIDIPLKVIDVRQEFKKKVVKYFLQEYQAGRTPNPCVFCNEKLKFQALFSQLCKAKADFVATGHYARLRREIKNSKFQTKLFKAKDKNKDQSYFLYRLKQNQLTKLFFPLGEYEKIQVKEMAKEFGLGLEEKRESQNICFLLDDDTGIFLKKNLRLKSGDIVSQDGVTLGRHLGLPLYTIGQRRGINIGGTGPYYVFKKDKEKNILSVTNNSNDPALFFSKVVLEKISWTKGEIKLPLKAFVRTRYQQKAVYAIILKKKEGTSKNQNEYTVDFKSPQKFIASGQSAVFYSDAGEVIGGGIIKNSE